MMTTHGLERELRFYDRIEEEIITVLKSLPEGSLYFKTEHGKSRPYIFYNGKEKYLSGKSEEIINKLFKRRCMKESLKRIRANTGALNRMYSQYTELQNVLPYKIGQELLEEVEFDIDLGTLDLALGYRKESGADIDQWLAMPRNENPYKPEYKKHMTPGGVMIRSKEELVIAAFLESLELPYKYEEMLVLDGQLLYPDFTVKRVSDGKIIIWEHFGMMDDEGYKEKTLHKLHMYERNGYIPYDNFIATYGNNGSIDMTLLERIADLMLR